MAVATEGAIVVVLTIRRANFALIAVLTLFTHVLSACSGSTSPNEISVPESSKLESTEPIHSGVRKWPGANSDVQPIVLSVNVMGNVDQVFPSGKLGHLIFRRQNTSERVALKFSNGARGLYAIPMGKYRVERIGTEFVCHKIFFEVDASESNWQPQALEARIYAHRENLDFELFSSTLREDDIALISNLVGRPITSVRSQITDFQVSGRCRTDKGWGTGALGTSGSGGTGTAEKAAGGTLMALGAAGVVIKVLLAPFVIFGGGG